MALPGMALAQIDGLPEWILPQSAEGAECNELPITTRITSVSSAPSWPELFYIIPAISTITAVTLSWLSASKAASVMCSAQAWRFRPGQQSGERRV